MGTTFHEYRSGYVKSRKNSPPESVASYYAAMTEQVAHDETMLLICESEAMWYFLMSPEYKICSDMAEAMKSTSLSIACDNLRLPFRAFVLRLDTAFRSPIKNILVSSDTSHNIRWISIVSTMSTEKGEATYGMSFDLLSGVTIAECMSMCYGTSADDRKSLGTYTTDEKTVAKYREYACEIVSIVVATCFFATGRDRQQRFVTQDKPANHHERRVLAKAQKCRTSEIVLPPKFTVGRDVVLPKFEPGLSPPKSTPEPTAQCAECKHPFSDHSRPNLACAADGDPACVCGEFDTGRHLERGHIRSGHLHWYATGPRKPGPGETNDYVLKWVAPTIVRPDLPLAPVKSRIIKTPANKIVSAGESSS